MTHGTMISPSALSLLNSPTDGNECNDSEIWFRPEPEDQEDDIEGSAVHNGDDMKLGKPGVLSRLGEEWIPNMIETMKDGFKEHMEERLTSMGISCSGNDGDNTWADTITDLLWEAVSYLKPYAFYGKELDPNQCVKVKCIATGSRNQSKVFKGLVFRKHAAHKHMPTKFIKPRLLLIRGALSVSSDGSSSMKQEKDRVDYLMSVIEKINPNIILVEKTVSHAIQESILAKGMTLVLEMNQSRLEKVGRCTGSPILSSDKLSYQQLRQCESFYFEEIEEEHSALCENGKRPTKTILFLEGCPTRMGFTILLKGSHSDKLKKIKGLVQYAIEMAYHLIRENLFFIKNVVVGISGKTKLSNCNEDHVKYKDDTTAVIGSGGIPVFISSRHATRGTACKQSLSHIKSYPNFDMPLGVFLVDDLSNQKHLCGTCKELPEAHIYYYTHDNKRITVQVKRLPYDNPLPGENEGKLWMWSICGKCKPSLKSTKRVLVSVGPRGVSFGKILEHAFTNHSSWEIPSSCGHLFYGDYCHLYGVGSIVVMFRYSLLPTYSLSLPLRKVEFSNSIEGRFLKTEIEYVVKEGRSMFAEFENSLREMENKLFGPKLKLQVSSKRLSDIKEMLKQEQHQFYVNMSNVSVNKRWLYKPLYLNHIHWKLSLLSYIWDQRLYSFHKMADTQTSGEKQFCFQEKDISEYDSVLSLKSSDPKGWMWRPFSEIESIYFKDLQRGLFPSYEASFYSTTGSVIHKIITEQGSKLHFPMDTEDSNPKIVSDYEAELSSIIACALASLQNPNNSSGYPNEDVKSYQSLKKMSSMSFPDWCCFNFMDSDGPSFYNPSEESSISDGLEWPDSSSYFHPVIYMGRLANTKTAKYSVACLFHKEFRDLRSHFGLSEVDYISSLSRCRPWDAKGGKSKSFFAKTLDDRFIIKQINKTEFRSILKTGLAYYAYMNHCFQHGTETCLAKYFGVYQVTNKKSGAKYDLMVMENISYDRKFSRQYDLKGALYGRLKAVTDGAGDVLLDQNIVNDMNLSSICFDRTEVWKLQRAIRNDTSFLHFINVMDYSLLVGVDTQKKELVCGIIDYVRQYTLDKKAETWFKSFKVPKNHLPTIISPQEYKKRFTKFIEQLLDDPISARVQEEIQNVHPMAQICSHPTAL